MDKKNKIILAAISEFAKKGFEKASVDAIALKAKVAKGTVFYYFRSKNDLFVGIVDEGQKMLEKKMEDEIKEIKTNKLRIEKIVEIEIEFIKKYHDLFLVYLEDMVKKSISFEVINKVINDGIKKGEFKNNLDIKMASILIFWSTAMICLNLKKIDKEKIKMMVVESILA